MIQDIIFLSHSVLLRNIVPGSEEYPNNVALLHLLQLDLLFLEKENNACGKTFKDYQIEQEGIITKDNFFSVFTPLLIKKRLLGNEFDYFGLEKEGTITTDNFFSDFIPSYVIDSRKLCINGLREGLTLDGKVIAFFGVAPVDASQDIP